MARQVLELAGARAIVLDGAVTMPVPLTRGQVVGLVGASCGRLNRARSTYW
ncbi:MAG: hypothetical protein RMJ43_10935 [Chloroherpetonaceae bacterium]|nr:hypothetical protein [Chthonomonadaceae bacterium]MDW8208343.1 hypothetical protein [Chloroherpetonaceae bacterium]